MYRLSRAMQRAGRAHGAMGIPSLHRVTQPRYAIRPTTIERLRTRWSLTGVRLRAHRKSLRRDASDVARHRRHRSIFVDRPSVRLPLARRAASSPGQWVHLRRYRVWYTHSEPSTALFPSTRPGRCIVVYSPPRIGSTPSSSLITCAFVSYFT